MSISPTEYQRLLRRHEPAVEQDESSLHSDIMGECAARGFYCIHSRMDKRTTTQVGSPDFVVVMPRRVVFIEAKTRVGKLSQEQLGVAAWLKKLGHELFVVRSLNDFRKVVGAAQLEMGSL